MAVNHEWLARQKLQNAKKWLRAANSKTASPAHRFEDLATVFLLLVEIDEHLAEGEARDGG